MEINIVLLDVIFSQLSELSIIVEEKKYDPDIVLGKIKDVIGNLISINTIPQIDLDKYQENLKSWNGKLYASRNAHKELTQYASQMTELTEKLLEKRRVQRNLDPVLMKKIVEIKWNDEKEEEVYNAIVFDMGKEVTGVLTGNMRIHFTRKRLIWIWKSRILFSSHYITSNIAKVIVSVTAGFFGEWLVQTLFHGVPQLIIGIIVAILSFFSLDHWMDERLKKYFWKETTKEVYILFLHLKVYVDQIIILNSNEFKNKQ